jgi:uncharacterized protein (TIGR02271 family)
MSVPGPDTPETRVLPAVEEALIVDKVEVDQGGYRITKRVHAHDQQVDQLLRSEHVEIERRPINTAIADGAIPPVRQEGDTLVVPVVEEVLITVKRLVLVEEVRITRVQDTRRETRTVTLRKEAIEVERLDAWPPSAAQSS